MKKNWIRGNADSTVTQGGYDHRFLPKRHMMSVHPWASQASLFILVLARPNIYMTQPTENDWEVCEVQNGRSLKMGRSSICMCSDSWSTCGRSPLQSVKKIRKKEKVTTPNLQSHVLLDLHDNPRLHPPCTHLTGDDWIIPVFLVRSPTSLHIHPPLLPIVWFVSQVRVYHLPHHTPSNYWTIRIMFVLYRFGLLVRVLSRLSLKSTFITYPTLPNQLPPACRHHGRKRFFFNGGSPFLGGKKIF